MVETLLLFVFHYAELSKFNTRQSAITSIQRMVRQKPMKG